MNYLQKHRTVNRKQAILTKSPRHFLKRTLSRRERQAKQKSANMQSLVGISNFGHFFSFLPYYYIRVRVGVARMLRRYDPILSAGIISWQKEFTKQRIE